MIYQNVKNMLALCGFDYQEITHEATTSCEHSRALRDAAWLEGAGSKNIVFHAKGKFYLVTTLWDKEIKARRFKGEFGTKDIRFASQEELSSQGMWVIGSIPPIGFENREIPVFVDSEIFDHKYFLFNPWDPTKSIRLKTKDLKKIYLSLSNDVVFFAIHDDEYERIDPEDL